MGVHVVDHSDRQIRIHRAESRLDPNRPTLLIPVSPPVRGTFLLGTPLPISTLNLLFEKMSVLFWVSFQADLLFLRFLSVQYNLTYPVELAISFIIGQH